MWAPSLMKKPNAAERLASYFRAAASPGAAAAIMKMNREIDVRNILPTIRTPTLILHRTADRVSEIGHARYMAEHINKAMLIELPGIDHVYWTDGGETIVDHIEQFVTGRRKPPNSLSVCLRRSCLPISLIRRCARQSLEIIHGANCLRSFMQKCATYCSSIEVGR